ncbi:MAG: hypothetical protein RR620_13110 [Clostridium sp.]
MKFNAGVEQNIPSDLLEKLKEEVVTHESNCIILDYIESEHKIGKSIIHNFTIYYQELGFLGVFEKVITIFTDLGTSRKDYSNNFIHRLDIEKLIQLTHEE